MSDPVARHYAVERRGSAGGGYWRVALMRSGQRFCVKFADAEHGGREQALAAALAYRDHIVATHPPASMLELRQLKRRGKEGMAGVQRAVRQHRSGRCTIYWVACTLMPDGHYRKRSFSEDRYGESRARQLAEQARQAHLAEIEDAPARVVQHAMQGDGQLGSRGGIAIGTHYHGIVRGERKRKGGYWRLLFQRNHRRFYAVFADAEHGGAEQALRMALAHRDRLLAENPEPASKRRRAGLSVERCSSGAAK